MSSLIINKIAIKENILKNYLAVGQFLVEFTLIFR